MMSEEKLLDVEDFGQKADLCVRIREILRNYPEGSSILKELIQNADDAGATEISFVLDLRIHEKDTLWSNDMALFQGDSLLVFNNATFTETDFLSITRIGDSLKKENSKGIKTGRFGVGFNSVYHLTDVPQFVSDRYVVMFDPQAKYLPGINPANPGKIIDFLKPNSKKALASTLYDQFEPLRAFGNDFSKPFKGTLFRLPLRRKVWNQINVKSRLSKDTHSRDTLKATLDKFCHRASSMLLFLKCLEKISVGVWLGEENGDKRPPNPASTPNIYYSASIESLTPKLKSLRAFVTTAEAAAKLAASTEDAEGVAQQQTIDYTLKIRSNWKADSQGVGIGCNNKDIVSNETQDKYRNNGSNECAINLIEEWSVCNQLGGGQSSDIATNKENLHLKLVPWAGAAALVKRTDLNGNMLSTSIPTTDGAFGQVYCFLPLPVHTGLPVHINGYFELSSNRRDIWSGTDMAGDGALRAAWNECLLHDIVVPCYVRLLVENSLRLGREPDSDQLLAHYQLFPTDRQTSLMWKNMIGKFYREVENSKLLYTTSTDGHWISCTENAYLLPDIQNTQNLIPTVESEENFLTKLEVIFSETKIVNVVHGLPGSLKAILRDYGVVSKILNQRTVRSLLRTKSLKDFLLHLVSKRQNDSFVDIVFLLQFCLSDLNGDSYAEMDNIKLLPMLDGTLGVIQRRTSVKIDEGAVKQLTSMGFPYLVVWVALRKHNNDVVASSTWLLQMQQCQDDRKSPKITFPDEIWDEAPYYVCSDIERELLLGQVQRAVVNIEACPTHLKQILRSKQFQEKVNINLVTPQIMSHLVKDTLPPRWRNLPCVDWNYEDTPDKTPSMHIPSAKWIKSLWKYVSMHAKSDLKYFENGCPLIPTCDNKLYTVKRALPILMLPISSVDDDVAGTVYDSDMPGEPESINQAIQETLEERQIEMKIMAVLQNIGATRLNAKVMSGIDVVGHLSPRYIQKPNRDGILEVINSVVAMEKSKYSDIFRNVDSSGRDTLRIFLAKENLDQLSTRACKIISRLPIYLTYRKESQIKDAVGYQSLNRSHKFLQKKILNIHEDVMPANYLKLESPFEIHLITKLGVPTIDEITFCVDHLCCNASTLEPSSRDKTMQSVLVNLSRLCMESKGFAELLSDTSFVPDENGYLHKPADLYDYEVPQLAILLSDAKNVFPSKSFAPPEMLPPLRKLGLRKQLTRAKILECATSLSVGTNDKCTREKSLCLLEYLDARGRELFSIPKRTFLSSLNFHKLDASDSTADVIAKFTEDLASIPWVPVMTESPVENLPWRTGGVGKLETRLASEVRPSKDMWLCSYSLGILRGNVQSKYLQNFFGWNKPIHPRVVAMQLLVLGQSYKPDEQLNRELSTQVPNLYKSLSVSLSGEAKLVEQVKQILMGTKWVWCGDSFVSHEDVAFVTPVIAKPHLYQIPTDMEIAFGSLFKTLGVREKFNYADFANALQRMYEKHKNTPLEKADVDTAVALAQELSNTPLEAANCEIFAPNEHCVLVSTKIMVYNDAPWMSKRNYITTKSNNMVFVHPKISNDVAKNIQVKSFRSTLIENETEDFLSGFEVKSFGQVEPLTGRLRHILELYPEGPGIINELIQNADDAGATEFSVMLNLEEYGTNSLLGPKLSKWQGPAVYVHNNATFSNQDFANLVKIGQASKLEKLSTTGRFGLGFNSVYHFTDLPSFVTGEYVVMFDPHTDYIPHATHQQPGLKLRFCGSKIIDQFPDQFKPYLFFGNNMREYYNGTLFRFPLRKKEHRSQIKNQPYSINSMKKILDQFKKSIVHSMLFLRHIKKISVYVKHAPSILGKKNKSDSESFEDNLPVLMYQTYISKQNTEKNSIISTFLNSTKSKASMYAKLLRTPEETLPKFTDQIEITTEYANDGNTESCLMQTHVSKFLISQRLGGGRARHIACSKENMRLKLVPWGGVAVNLTTGSKRVGRAFCFLPLPAETGLPVHVHGYFELSSNRRNIWFGDDMAGEGAIKAKWNSALLEDVVAPCYKQLLLAARDLMPPSTNRSDNDEMQYYKLFPKSIPGGPWEKFTEAFFKTVRDAPILYSLADGGQWISPQNAFLVKKGLFPKATLERLVSLLLKENIPIVDVFHDGLTELLVKFKCVQQVVSPKKIRDHFRKKQNHVVLQKLEDAMFILDICTKDIRSEEENEDCTSLLNLRLLPLADGSLSHFSDTKSNKPVFVCSRWNETRMLEPISFLLVDPRVVGESDERKPQNSCFNSVAKFLRPCYNPQIAKQTNIRQLNPASFASLLSYMYPKKWKGMQEVLWVPGNQLSMLEPNKDITSERNDDEKANLITAIWLTRLWRFLSDCSEDGIYEASDMEYFVNEWPILPTRQPKARTLMSLRKGVAIIDPTGMRQVLRNLFARIGVRAVDTQILPHPPMRFVKPGTPLGCLEAIFDSVEGDLNLLGSRFKVLLPDALRDLREYLGSVDWAKYRKSKPLAGHSQISADNFSKQLMSADEPRDIDHLSVMRALPIYEVYDGKGSNLDCDVNQSFFQALTNDHYLVPDYLQIFEKALNSRFLVTRASREKILLLSLGVEERELPTSIIAEQLVHMGKYTCDTQAGSKSASKDTAADFIRTIDKNIVDVYLKLASLAEDSPSELDAIKIICKDEPWIWINGKFRKTESVAFRCPQNAAPFLYEVPSYVKDNESLRKLWSCLGVRDEFAASDFVLALQKLHDLVQEQPLEKSQLDFSIALLQMLAESNAGSKNVAIASQQHLYVPDENGILCPSDSIVYNDAEWLRNSHSRYKMCHSNISNTVASRIGVRSLRSLELETTKDMKEFSCPGAANVKDFLRAHNNTERIFSDLIEFADEMGSSSVVVSFDTRSYPSEAIMHPKMSVLQSSNALSIEMNDFIIQPNQILDALALEQASKSNRIRLISLFNLSDCLEIIAGEYLYIIDPSRLFTKHTSSTISAKEEDADTKDTAFSAEKPMAGNVRAYKWHMSNLTKKFPDSVCSFKSLCRLHKFSGTDKFNGTIIRAALRTSPSVISNNVLTEQDCIELLNKFKQITPFSCLFTMNVEEVHLLEWKQDVTLYPAHEQSPYVHCIAKINNAESVRSCRQKLYQNNDWHISGITRFFVGWKVQKSKYMLDISVSEETASSDELKDASPDAECKPVLDSYVDTYEVQMALGPGKTRDMAIELMNESPSLSQYLMPIVGIASHTHRNGLSLPVAKNGKSDIYNKEKTSVHNEAEIEQQDTQEIQEHNHEVFNGRIMRPAPLPLRTGLPVHIMAYVRVNPTGTDFSNEGFSLQWNSILLENVTGDIYISLLKSIIGRDVAGAPKKSSTNKRMEKPIENDFVSACSKSDGSRPVYVTSWPIMSKVTKSMKPYVNKTLHRTLADRAYYYSSMSKAYVKLNNGVFPGSHMPHLVQSYLAKQLEFLDVPPAIADDLSDAGVIIRRMDPPDLRLHLKKNDYYPKLTKATKNKADGAEQEVDPVCLSLLEYCTSDFVAHGKDVDHGDLGTGGDGAFGEIDAEALQRQKYSSLCGLRLCPTCDGGAARFLRLDAEDSKKTLLIATDNERALLPSASNLFIHPKVLRSKSLEHVFRNAGVMQTLNISKFNSSILASHIGAVLPAVWKGKLRVVWDDPGGESGQPTHLWLRQFWSIVSITDERTVDLFRDYPLVPLCSGELLSCSLLNSTLLLDIEKQNNPVTNDDEQKI